MPDNFYGGLDFGTSGARISIIDLHKELVYSNSVTYLYGFKNPNSIYEKPINSMLLGDSYAEGFCVTRREDIAGNLDAKGFSTVNFGVAATGPLISLAIMREFGNFIKPKNFIYLYFEGNDLDGLNWEKNDSNLIQYLNSEYNVDYINNYDSIKYFLSLSSKESMLIGKSKLELKEFKKSKLEIIKEHASDIIELQSLKNIFRYKIFNKERDEYDLDLFFSVIEKMNVESKKLNSNYIFVYVPTWSRYFTKNTRKEASIKLKDKILSNLKSKKIKAIDLSEFFKDTNNVEQYFPLGYLGHYNAAGYRKISEIIANELKP